MPPSRAVATVPMVVTVPVQSMANTVVCARRTDHEQTVAEIAHGVESDPGER